MTHTSKLPDKPSALIRVALGDLQKCLDNAPHNIDLMRAVLIQTFGASPTTELNQYTLFRGNSTHPDVAKLGAIEAFEFGWVYIGLVTLGLDPNATPELISIGQKRHAVSDFDSKLPKKFFRDMRKIADSFERIGY